MILFTRIAALVRKEFQSLLNTRSGRLLLVMPVVVQTALFPFAATLEVKNASLAVLNDDAGAESIELIQRFAASGAFTTILPVTSSRELDHAIATRKALLAARIPGDFSRRLATGEASSIQVVLDGRRSNSSQIAFNYLQSVIDQYLKDRAADDGRVLPTEVVVRNWFVPNLGYESFILPSLVAIITTIGALIVTGLSVAREREQGTFEQLLVSPLSPEMIMIGKAVPAVIIGYFQASLILSAAVFVYQVPFRGSLLLLYGAMFFYALSLVGVGLFISAMSKTQQQAFLGVFAFMVPGVLLSGYTAPVENMPLWLQHASWINPVRHFVEITKGIHLKNAGSARVLELVMPLWVISTLTLTAAAIMFRRKTG